MNREQARQQRLRRRRTGIRKRIFGTPERPRLSVYRSSKHMYAQVIDDFSGHTLAASNTLEQKLEKPSTVEAAKEVGRSVAEKAKSAGIQTVTFDRNGFRYHGRVAQLADAAREGGLNF